MNAAERKAYREAHQEAFKVYARRWYLKHRGRILAERRRYVASHMEQIKGYGRIYHEKNKERSRAASLKWFKDHRASFLVYSRRYQRKARESFADSYVRRVLARHLPVRVRITEEMIRAKRIQLMVLRKVKEKTDEVFRRHPERHEHAVRPSEQRGGGA